MTSQPGNQTIAIHILPNVSRNKGSHTMKFGQVIEYNMKTFFFKKNTQNEVEKTFPDPFLKKQNCAYLQTKLQATCFYLMLNFFKKQKEV